MQDLHTPWGDTGPLSSRSPTSKRDRRHRGNQPEQDQGTHHKTRNPQPRHGPALVLTEQGQDRGSWSLPAGTVVILKLKKYSGVQGPSQGVPQMHLSVVQLNCLPLAQLKGKYAAGSGAPPASGHLSCSSVVGAAVRVSAPTPSSSPLCSELRG